MGEIESEVPDRIRRIDSENFTPDPEAAVMGLIAIHPLCDEPFKRRRE